MQKLPLHPAAAGQRAAGIGGHQRAVAHSGPRRRKGRAGRVHHQAAARVELVAAAMSHSIPQSKHLVIIPLFVYAYLVVSLIDYNAKDSNH